MKLFRTGSSSTVNFGFLPAKSQILIRTASFLQKFIASTSAAADNRLAELQSPGAAAPVPAP